ncbi:pentatricopeptide repeat-containing protein At4g21705, mitochondrial [Olea europaea var. sylvestris]|uniref:pentatricopeptide repeat-containing protein At4g21705, mitochondrial n=1 Tax=Olea europaea var. sylvestris TaxID=158386 RepID=UPI000C1CD8E9|nr:pentatricopeptide repeat-containing protein At4g21705, mitochondrial [Olea europaea var. sylvestris]
MSHCKVQIFTNPTMFSTLNRSHSFSNTRNLIFLRKALSLETYCTIIAASPTTDVKFSASRSRNLFSRISPIRQDGHIVPVLDQWVAEGRKINYLELQRIIRDLRSRRRFSQALQISEWMSCKDIFEFTPGDFAVHLDLIGVVHGWEAAERYFGNLSDLEKNEKTYGALLNCYVREGSLDKTLTHMQRMKDKGYASSLAYNNLMTLYKKTGQLEKIPDVLSEMKRNGIAPNNFSYRICIRSYGERSDLNGMEKLAEEIRNQPDISIDWATYSNMAYCLIKANEKEKALHYLKKLEEKLDKDALGYNHLISLYAHLGNKDEMMRLWVLQKDACKKQINRDYITMLGSLVKLGEFEMAETLLKDWDSSCRMYDFRVPNILLIGYCQKGLIEKAETMLRDIMARAKTPTPNSWAIITAGYLNKDNMEKAFECLKEALAVKEENTGWMPKPTIITRILNWLGEKADPEQVEAFLRSLRTVSPVNRHMYHTLIKVNKRVGREVDSILESMKADQIDADEETEKILSLG